jgi:hypothetical protein
MKITKYERIDKGAWLSTVSIRIDAWGMNIHGIKCIHKKDGSKFVTLPSKAVQRSDGNWDSHPYIELDAGDRFREALLKLIEEYELANPPVTVHQQTVANDRVAMFDMPQSMPSSHDMGAEGLPF